MLPQHQHQCHVGPGQLELLVQLERVTGKNILLADYLGDQLFQLSTGQPPVGRRIGGMLATNDDTSIGEDFHPGGSGSIRDGIGRQQCHTEYDGCRFNGKHWLACSRPGGDVGRRDRFRCDTGRDRWHQGGQYAGPGQEKRPRRALSPGHDGEFRGHLRY